MDVSSETHKIEEGFVGQQMIVLPPNVRARVGQNPLIREMYLTAIGFYPHAVYHDRTRTRGSQEYILLYCTEGEGYVTLEHQELHLTPNHYIIIPPLQPHHYRSSRHDPWSIYWVHFTGSNADILYHRYHTPGGSKVRPIPYDERRLNGFIRSMEMLESSFDEESLEIVNVAILHFLTTLIYHSETNPAFQRSDVISASVEFLGAHLKETFSVSELAAQQNLSVSRYSELFKEKTGYSPVKYFNNLKIQKSCQYLYFTDLSVKEICPKVGFEDPYYFSRMFKKLMGIAPSRYRVRYKSSAPS